MFPRIVLILACLLACLAVARPAGGAPPAPAPATQMGAAAPLPLCASLHLALPQPGRVRGAEQDCALRAWPWPLRPESLQALWARLPLQWRGPLARAWAGSPLRRGLRLDLGMFQLHLVPAARVRA